MTASPSQVPTYMPSSMLLGLCAAFRYLPASLTLLKVTAAPRLFATLGRGKSPPAANSALFSYAFK